MSAIEFTDRYSATGRPPPRLISVCLSGCEGMGCYPVKAHEPQSSYFEKYPHMRGFRGASVDRELTEYEAGAVHQYQTRFGVDEEGWYFIPCGECGGSGRCRWWQSVLRVPWVVWKAIQFVRHALPNRAPHMSRFEHVRLVLGIAVGVH